METVIQEIANQLGMAVDQAGVFISEQLPNYAAVKAMYAQTSVIVGSIVLGIAVLLTVVGAVSFFKEIRKPYSSSNDGVAIFGLVMLVIGVGLIVGSICALECSIPDMIGWLNYPEGMLIDTVLKKVG